MEDAKGSLGISMRLVVTLLRSRPNVYCSPCLAETLAIPKNQFREAVQTLVLNNQMRIQRGTCANCRQEIDVLQLEVPPMFRTSESRPSRLPDAGCAGRKTGTDM